MWAVFALKACGASVAVTAAIATTAIHACFIGAPSVGCDAGVVDDRSPPERDARCALREGSGFRKTRSLGLGQIHFFQRKKASCPIVVRTIQPHDHQ